MLEISKKITHEKFGTICIGAPVLYEGLECARALGYPNPDDAIKRHCPKAECHSKWVEVSTEGTAKHFDAVHVPTLFINSDDLGTLISNAPQPYNTEFESWVRSHGLFRRYGDTEEDWRDRVLIDIWCLCCYDDSIATDSDADRIIDYLRAQGLVNKENSLFTRRALELGYGKNVQTKTKEGYTTFKALLTRKGVDYCFDYLKLTPEVREPFWMDVDLFSDFHNHRCYCMDEIDGDRLKAAIDQEEVDF